MPKWKTTINVGGRMVVAGSELNSDDPAERNYASLHPELLQPDVVPSTPTTPKHKSANAGVAPAAATTSTEGGEL